MIIPEKNELGEIVATEKPFASNAGVNFAGTCGEKVVIKNIGN